MKQSRSGQGLVEYALILVLVALLLMFMLTTLAPETAGVFSKILYPLAPLFPPFRALNGEVITPVNTAVDIDIDELITYDHGGFLDYNSLTVSEEPSNGSTEVIYAGIIDGLIRYTPEMDFIGIVHFSYTISNTDGETDAATVTVIVGPVMIAVDDLCEVDVNTPKVCNVTLNDITSVAGLDPTSVEVTEGPVFGGEAVSNPDGTVTYTPMEGSTGIDLFDYTVSNTAGVTDTATVHVFVGTAPDESLMAAAAASGTGTDSGTLTDALEKIAEYESQVVQQEQFVLEAGQPLKLILAHFLEAQAAHATEIMDEDLMELVSDLQEKAESGNYAQLVYLLVDMGSLLAGLPAEMQTNMVLDFVLLLTESCRPLSDAIVSSDSFNAALQALNQLELEAPGSTGEAIPLLEETWDQIEPGNRIIERITSLTAFTIDTVAELLKNSGIEEYEILGQHYQLKSAVCDVGWNTLYGAISAADIDPEGIRNSLKVKADSASSYTNLGYLDEAGGALCDLVHELDAQEDKNVNADSAAEIRDTVFNLGIAFDIPLECSN